MRLTRRGFVLGAAGVTLALPTGYVAARKLRHGGSGDPDPKGDFPSPPRQASCAEPGNAIVAENCRPGTPGWRLSRVDGRIEGFFDASSVNRGQEIALRVRCADPEYHVEVYRTGYYDDVGARLVARTSPRRAAAQPEVRSDARTGLTSASGWSVSERFDTTSWPTGVYLAKLVSSGGSDDHAILVVRDDDTPSDVLVLVSDTTFLAYNYWGGPSLYSGGADDPRAVRVSFDRPYGNVRVNQADWYLRADHCVARFLEADGYDVSYAAVSDLHTGADLGKRQAWVSGIHNEYWSIEMRRAFEAARDRGTGLVFMGSNTGYWRVRFEPDPWTDTPNRVMVCFKESELSLTTLGEGPKSDPVAPTGLWRNPNGSNEPENAVVGVMYAGQNLRGYSPLVVPTASAADPLWRDAGLKGEGATIGRELVGWEWDAVFDNGQSPKGLRMVAATPVTGQLMSAVGKPGEGDATAAMTAYTAASGAHVFATGSNLFAWGLDREGRRAYDPGKPQGEPDRRVRQLMTNVLGQMGCTPRSPADDLTIEVRSEGLRLDG
jgi:hypothetical protein